MMGANEVGAKTEDTKTEGTKTVGTETVDQLDALMVLCDGISLQPEVRAQVLSLYKHMDFSPYRELMDGQLSPATWDESYERLKNLLAPVDEKGFMMLTCMLTWALNTWENYRKAGISDEIFFDTMGCFTRFVGEHMASYGEYGFDRGFWTSRQLAMRLFRIGELEYELRETENEKVVRFHIPSDSDFRMDRVKESYDQACEFLRTYYPEYASVPFKCDSWLLSPGLAEELSPESNILKFQQLFEIVSNDEDSMEFLQWLYGRGDIPIEELPENTSLQRRVKQRLLRGGKIGKALGVLKKRL